MCTENIMFSIGLCGHFALSTLFEAWLKETVFEINLKILYSHSHRYITYVYFKGCALLPPAPFFDLQIWELVLAEIHKSMKNKLQQNKELLWKLYFFGVLFYVCWGRCFLRDLMYFNFSPMCVLSHPSVTNLLFATPAYIYTYGCIFLQFGFPFRMI